jgi:hypothetical protein
LKDGRKIIIQNRQLKKIRNQIRSIILCAVDFRLEELLEQMSPFHALEAFWDKKHQLHKELKLAYRRISNEREKLYYDKKKSILFCVLCGQSNKDMVFRANRNEWFCIDCSLKIPDIIPGIR